MSFRQMAHLKRHNPTLLPPLLRLLRLLLPPLLPIGSLPTTALDPYLPE